MNADPQPPLRPPSQVMRLSRMGSFFPTRISFMRSLIRQLNAEQAQVTRPVWEIDPQGYGRAVYSVILGGDVYSLVAFSNRLDPERRTDRVIAEAWDTAFALFDGTPGPADLDRLQVNAPKQEAGRFSVTELVISRANKSLRLFEHVVDSLSRGVQPDAEMVGQIGYLMRTTAVYGNGKFGIADRARISERPALSGPFRAELLTVWLIRGFTHDLVEHVARARDPKRFTPLDPRLKRYIGIGNATGLGMAPFLVSHPILLNNWMLARETALARVRGIDLAAPATIARFRDLLARARRHVADWNVDDAGQMARIAVLRSELADLEALATVDFLAQPAPWDRLVTLSARWSEECQEMLVALVLEPHGDLIDGLADCMGSALEPKLEPGMQVGTLRALFDREFGWTSAIDFTRPEAAQQFWYVSEEKLEPRLGDRYTEPGAELESPLDIARQAQALAAALAAPDQTVAAFLMSHPQVRHVARRLQAAAHCPYSEIRDNLIGAECRAIDMLRCKLSFFGAAKFDPKSDRWTRITMYQGAPTAETIGEAGADDWSFPVFGEQL